MTNHNPIKKRIEELIEDNDEDAISGKAEVEEWRR